MVILSNKIAINNPYLREYGRVPSYVYNIKSDHCFWSCGV